MATWIVRSASENSLVLSPRLYFRIFYTFLLASLVTVHAGISRDVVRATSLDSLVLRKPKCPLGSVPTSSLENPSCKPCPPGYFHRGIYSLKCQPCPKNTFNAFAGGVTRTVCRPCGISSISTEASSSCKPCKKGLVAVRSPACISCPPGTALPLRGTKCRSCHRGFFSSMPNTPRCEACPKGTTSNDARTACVYRSCPPGQEWSGNSCIQCGPNRYRKASMQTCELCPLRTIPDTKSTSCVFCKPGTRITNLFTETFSRTCEPCQANLTTKGKSKPICAVSANDSSNPSCPQYTFRDAEGDCDRCARDEYIKETSEGRRICASCADGTWSPGGAARSCVACGKDQVMLPPSSIQSLGDSRHITRCSCPDGHVVSDAYDRLWNRPDLSNVAVCEKCPAGTYKGTGELRCEPCAPDEFSNAGATVCDKCPDGTYSLPKMGASCVPLPKCPTGFTHRDPIDGCVNGATGCPIGSKLQPIGGGDSARTGACVKASRKLACTGGTVYDGVSACIQCTRGFYLSRSTVNAPNANGTDVVVTKWACEQCPFGTFSDKENAYRCKKCPSGFVGTQDRCLCDVGYYIDQHRLTCRECPQVFPFSLHYDCSLSTFLHLW